MCCYSISLRSVISRKNSVRIYWPEGRQVNFYSSIFYCINKSRTRCLQTSVYSLLDGLGRVLLVLASSSFHQLISLIPVSLMLTALLKASIALQRVYLCFLSTIRQISLNQSSICLRMALYQTSSVFLFFLISTSTYLILSNSSSKILKLSSLSLAILPTEFLLGITL